MIDVAEGDCYIVDLLNEDGSAEVANNWARYIIDTGGSKIEDDKRWKAIRTALTEGLPHDPWPAPKELLKDLPPLSGIVITHSDQDHAGNAHLLFKALSRVLGESITWTSGSGPVTAYITPSSEWRQKERLKDTKASEYFMVQPLEHGIEVVWKNCKLTATRSFRSLPELCELAEYDIRLR